MTGKFYREEKNNGRKLGSVKPVQRDPSLVLILPVKVLMPRGMERLSQVHRTGKYWLQNSNPSGSPSKPMPIPPSPDAGVFWRKTVAVVHKLPPIERRPNPDSPRNVLVLKLKVLHPSTSLSPDQTRWSLDKISHQPWGRYKLSLNGREILGSFPYRTAWYMLILQ